MVTPNNAAQAQSEDKNMESTYRLLAIKDTTVKKLQEALLLMPEDTTVTFTLYPPGDDYTRHCRLEFLNGDVEIAGVDKNEIDELVSGSEV